MLQNDTLCWEIVGDVEMPILGLGWSPSPKVAKLGAAGVQRRSRTFLQSKHPCEAGGPRCRAWETAELPRKECPSAERTGPRDRVYGERKRELFRGLHICLCCASFPPWHFQLKKPVFVWRLDSYVFLAAMRLWPVSEASLIKSKWKLSSGDSAHFSDTGN